MPEKVMLKTLLIFSLALALLLAACNAAPDSANLLVWRGVGARPAGGDLGFINGDQFQPLMEVPAQAQQVNACGSTATSPDGRLFAFYVGGNNGRLYVMQGRDAPREVGSASAFSCLGNGTFHYSPDSRRIAYIDTGSTPTNGEFITGTLRVMAANDGTELLNHENVAAFDLNNNSAAFISFLTNSRRLVDEAVVWWWDGGQEREIATLKPDQNCRYTSASLGLLPTDGALLVMGQRCAGGQGSSWQLYRAGLNDNSLSLVANGTQRGGFLPYTRTNTLVIAPGGETAYFTVPDGVVAHTASLHRVGLADLEVQEVVARQAVMPTLTDGTANAFPLRSPDGRWWALVVTSPNNENMLNVLDLTNPQAEPLTVSAGDRGDMILGMAFAPDSKRLYFVAGENGGDNALMQLELPGGAASRIRRGRFVPGVTLAPDGGALGLLEYQQPPDENQQPYLSLMRVSSGGEVATVYAGATLADGRVTERSFAVPLSWRP